MAGEQDRVTGKQPERGGMAVARINKSEEEMVQPAAPSTK